MPSSRRSKKITDEILEDFALPDYPAREMESYSMASSAGGSRAIDRYVATVLSESDDDSIYSTARKSASHSHRSVHFDDDSSFEPVNPFDGSLDTSYENSGKWKRKMQKHWKPLTILAFGVMVICLVAAGVASSKNDDVKTKDNGNKAVGMPSGLTSTHAPIKVITSEPSYVPTSTPTTEPIVQEVVEIEEPTYLPSYMPTVDNSTDSFTTEPPLKVTARPIAKPTTKTPTKSPTSKPVAVTKKPTGSPSRKPTDSPTMKPSSGPTMPIKYQEMLKAAKFVSGKEAFERTDTAQSLAFHWLYFSGNPSTNLYEFFEQYATAVIFFSLTKMHTSSMLPQDAANDFTSRREICGWSGVRCAYNYTSEIVHVTEIKLPAKKLTGTIPSEIGFLPYLKEIDLANNDISGTIPLELYGLQKLRRLYLNDNKLQGTISPRIDELNLAECKSIVRSDFYFGMQNLSSTNSLSNHCRHLSRAK